jgi:hypothetical protein
MGLLSKGDEKRTLAQGAAAKAGANAVEAGQPVLILRTFEKLTEAKTSGAPVVRAMDVIAEIEGSGDWRFESMAVEQDPRTFGDRMTSFLTFRRVT